MPDILLTADRLLTGPAGADLPDGAVLVRDGVIVAVGLAGELAHRAPNAETRQFPGGTIMPGLIDAHAYLVLDAGADQTQTLRRFAEHDDTQLLQDMHTRAAAAQRVGVTTLRDVGDSRGLVGRLRDADAADHRLPRLLTAGSPITTPGGNAAIFGGGVDASHLAAAVRQRAEDGADFISLVVSGGHLNTDDGSPAPYESQFDRGQIETVVAAARDVRLPVTAHAHGAQAIADAVLANADTVEHASFVVGAHEVSYDTTTVGEMATRGTAACVTGSLNWRRIVASMGAARAFDTFYGKLRWFYEAGVPQLIGSRAGTANAPFNDPVSAMELYEWAGVPRDVVLEYATAGAARTLGLASTTGSLAENLSADILVVDGDPRTDLGAVRRVQGVMQAGQWR